jgi:large conductance mechanosensitive channel
VLKDFKDFLFRGNVIHLSVAVIIGTTFTAAVTTVVNNWIGPMIGAFGGTNPNGLAITLVDGNLTSVMDFGAILTALIAFSIIAVLIYYLVILPVKEIQLRRAVAASAMPPEPTEVELLTDIKGLLLQQQNGNPARHSGDAGQTEPNPRQQAAEIGEGFSSYLVALPDRPGLVIDYGGNRITFAVGRNPLEVLTAHEFAVGLAYTALSLASHCRVRMSPRHAASASAARS